MAGNDFDEKLNQIKKMLEDENIAKTLNGIIDSMSSSNNQAPPQPQNKVEDFPEDEETSETQEQNTSPPPPPPSNPRTSNSPFNDLGGSIDAFSKISQMYNEINRTDSPSVNLLMAVKPYLNANRQSRLDRAAKVLNLSKLPNMMRGFDRD